MKDVVEVFHLDEDRRQLATSAERNALVLAGPGAGKTHLLVAHACWLAHLRNGRVTLLTYSRKAASEMKKRVDENLSTADSSLVAARTIHAHALELLRTYGNYVNLAGDIQVLETQRDLQEFADQVAREQAIPEVDDFASRFVQYQRLGGDLANPALPELVRAVDSEMRRTARVDWDSCVRIATELLRSNAEVRAMLLHHERYVLVDEAQDCDKGQLRFLEQLVGPPPGECHLFVVMDPDQSLYGFRQANPEVVQEWVSRYTGDPFSISENRRCAPRIQALAKHVLGRPAPVEPSEGMVSLHAFDSRADEARWVTATVRRYVANGIARNVAVLARRRSRLEAVEAELSREIKTRSDPRELWTPPENRILATIAFTKDWREGVFNTSVVLTFLISVIGLDADAARALVAECLALDQHPGDRVTAGLWLAFSNWVEAEKRSVVQVIEHLATKFGVKREELPSLLNIGGRARSLSDVLRLARNGPEQSVSNEGVLITTFHGAKGLEFDSIVVVGCEEGVIPDFRADSEAAVRDERRALYVAITRASRRVALTWLNRDYGRVRTVSPFLPDEHSTLWSGEQS